jgi:predicted N-acyltransferase
MNLKFKEKFGSYAKVSIDKCIDLDTLENNFETDIRRRRKAEKAGVKIIETEDIKTFYSLNKKTFDRKTKEIPYTYEFVKKLYESCKNKDAVKVFIAEYNGKPIATNFLVIDDNTVYYLMGGIDPENKSVGGMDLLQHHSIKFALENKKNFDFEGSMIESIEKYFRSFGAIQTPYFNISKTNSKFLKAVKVLKALR